MKWNAYITEASRKITGTPDGKIRKESSEMRILFLKFP